VIKGEHPVESRALGAFGQRESSVSVVLKDRQ
jgi:hypothetical protein